MGNQHLRRHPETSAIGNVRRPRLATSISSKIISDPSLKQQRTVVMHECSSLAAAGGQGKGDPGKVGGRHGRHADQLAARR